MNSEFIRDLIDKIPIGLIAFLYTGYLGYQYWDFKNGAGSQYVVQMKAFSAEQEVFKKMNLKLKDVQEFIKHLDDKKIELRNISKDLQDIQGSLSEYLDVPKFMKTVVTEASVAGVTILSLSPTDSEKKEYYIEQNFILEFRSAFVQFLAFVERLANTNDIVRIENFEMKASGANRAKFVSVSGKVELKTYRYLRSKADTVGKSETPGTNNANSKLTPTAGGTPP